MSRVSGHSRPAQWDDELWELVWERTLGHVERHSIAKAVWRQQVPDDPLHSRVACELARRWRAQARNLAIVYALWTLFWGAIGLDDLADTGMVRHPLALACAAVGLLAVVLVMAARRRLRALAQRRA